MSTLDILAIGALLMVLMVMYFVWVCIFTDPHNPDQS